MIPHDAHFRRRGAAGIPLAGGFAHVMPSTTDTRQRRRAQAGGDGTASRTRATAPPGMQGPLAAKRRLRRARHPTGSAMRPDTVEIDRRSGCGPAAGVEAALVARDAQAHGARVRRRPPRVLGGCADVLRGAVDLSRDAGAGVGARARRQLCPSAAHRERVSPRSGGRREPLRSTRSPASSATEARQDRRSGSASSSRFGSPRPTSARSSPP